VPRGNVLNKAYVIGMCRVDVNATATARPGEAPDKPQKSGIVN
jgi:hypothetical protein